MDDWAAQERALFGQGGSAALRSAVASRVSSCGDDEALARCLEEEELRLFAEQESSRQREERQEEESDLALAVQLATEQKEEPLDKIRRLGRDPDFGDPRWERCPRDFVVVRDAPRPADVVQGALGNCWFVSAIAALAAFRNGELVARLFDDKGGRGALVVAASFNSASYMRQASHGYRLSHSVQQMFRPPVQRPAFLHSVRVVS